ncbi:MAG: hypothetical protein NDJ90_02845 [Oligoflexia bacterium]|nr:hypothetical protein [Oligoflexia bacterium]
MTKHERLILLVGISVLFAPLGLKPRLATAAEKAPLILGQGEQRLLKFPGLLRYSVGSDAIRVIPLPRQFESAEAEHLLLKGVEQGSSDLWVWKQDGSSEHRAVRVEKLPRGELKPGLEKALGALEEAEVQVTGSGVVLRGEIHTLSESARLVALSEAYATEVHNETELAPALLEQGERRLSDWLRKARRGGALRLEKQEGSLALLGTIDRAADQQAIRKKARALFPAVVFQLDALPDDSPTVHFKVFLLELKRDRLQSLGLTWPALQEGAFRITSTGIQNLLQLDVALQALEGEGSARILSNPELVVRAPGEAELFSGGELPIHTRGRSFSNVTWKNFGLMLKLKVTHTTAERVRLDISTEVSHLDPSLSLDALPGIQANRMKTQVDARYGTPLLLSGLLQQGLQRKARGLPLLRQIPVLGALFGSEDYLNEKSELVAILLPSTVPPPAPIHRLGNAVSLRGPAGPVPPPRNWVSPAEERRLRSSPEFPWNVFDSATPAAPQEAS